MVLFYAGSKHFQPLNFVSIDYSDWEQLGLVLHVRCNRVYGTWIMNAIQGPLTRRTRVTTDEPTVRTLVSGTVVYERTCFEN